MKLVLQRVSEASVTVEGELISEIKQGMLILIGVEKGDTTELTESLAQKVLALRIFRDDADKMNRSIQDINGEILLVSQFTLPANLQKGNRPSFEAAEKPDIAQERIAEFVKIIEAANITCKQGKFGAMMDVKLTNDGPVTFILP